MKHNLLKYGILSVAMIAASGVVISSFSGVANKVEAGEASHHTLNGSFYQVSYDESNFQLLLSAEASDYLSLEVADLKEFKDDLLNGVAHVVASQIDTMKDDNKLVQSLETLEWSPDRVPILNSYVIPDALMFAAVFEGLMVTNEEIDTAKVENIVNDVNGVYSTMVQYLFWAASDGLEGSALDNKVGIYNGLIDAIDDFIVTSYEEIGIFEAPSIKDTIKINGIDEVVDKAVDVINNGINQRPEFDINSLSDYSQMKEKLAMEVVSTDANAELLSRVPHKEIEDMSIVYRFVLESNEDGRASILVTDQLLESMGVSPEQLHADALRTAPELKPVVIKGMSEVMAEMMGMSAEDLAMMGMPTDPADEQMYVATVPDKIHGAGVIAYQNFMDQAAERAGGDFFILPSSIHELLIVPDNGQMSLRDLEAMVREVNATQVAPEDKLTDNVYHYDAQAKVFELGEKFEDRKAEMEAGIDSKDSVIGELKAKKDEVAKTPKKDVIEKAAKAKGGEAI